jgi:hypothetical protein
MFTVTMIEIFLQQPTAVHLINKYPVALQPGSLYISSQNIANGYYTGPVESGSIITSYGTGIRRLNYVNIKPTIGTPELFTSVLLRHSLSLQDSLEYRPKISSTFHMAALRGPSHQNPVIISGILI